MTTIEARSVTRGTVRRPATTRSPGDAVRVAATVILCAAAIAGPLALGATAPWARFSLEAAMAVAGALWAASAPSTRSALLPLAAFGLVMLQIVPLPDSLLMAVAPVSCGAWKTALAGPERAWGSISIDPGTTLVQARRLLLGLTTVVAVADMARAPLQRRMLVGACSVCCAAVIGLALAFPSQSTDRVILGFIDMSGPIMFWKSPVHAPVQTAAFCESDWVVVGGQRYVSDSWIVGDRVGPYIVSNHYAGALAMLVPMMLAGWLRVTRGRLPPWCALLAAVMIGAGALATTVLIAKSRAGSAALFLSLLVLASLVTERRWPKRITAVAAIGCIGAILLVAVAMYGPFTGLERLFPEALHSSIASIIHDVRSYATEIAFRMFRAAPLLGTGLGTYWPLASRLADRFMPWFFTHNDYAQWLAETGLVGGSIVAFLGWRVVVRFRRFYAASVVPNRILDAGPWAALAGIVAHSFFDWNLHVPANAFVASLVAGLAVSSAAAPTRVWTRWMTVLDAAWFRTATRAAVAAGCIMAAVFLGRDAWSETIQRRMRDALAAARIAASQPDLPPATPVLAEALAAGQRAARRDPRNAQLDLLAGQIALHLAAGERGERAHHFMQSARHSFQSAQADCAECRGLPQPAPPTRKDR